MRAPQRIDRSAPPLPLQQAAARCALCAVFYWAARLLLGALADGLVGLWLHGPGVGTAPAVWQAVQWGASLLSGALALLAPVYLAGWLWPDLTIRLRADPCPAAVRLALPVYLAGAQLFSLLAGLVGRTTGSGQQVALPDTPLALLLAFAALCVLPAVLEELLFRGLAQGLLRPHGALLAVVGQAMLFALLHGSLSGILYALPAGLFFGLLAEQTGSVLPGMLLHLCNNALSFVQVLLQGAGFGGLAALLSAGCLAGFPLWAAAVLLRAKRAGRLHHKPLPPGAPPTALLRCREWLFTVLALLAAALLEALLG